MHAKRNPAGRRGEAKRFKEAPPGARLGDNANAFLGTLSLWKRVVR